MIMGSRTASKLEALIGAFEARKVQDLKRLGSDLISEAAVKNEVNLAKISVIAYSLYKILSKDHFLKNRKWPSVSESIDSELLKAVQSAEKGDEKGLNEHLSHAIHKIELIDEELSNFARNIFEKARIKQASSAYASGLSLAQAASLTGADKKELQKYIGATTIHDEQPVFMGIEQRLQALREALGK